LKHVHLCLHLNPSYGGTVDYLYEVFTVDYTEDIWCLYNVI